ncbi:MAG: lipase family protein [Chitinophagaceae bacterium]
MKHIKLLFLLIQFSLLSFSQTAWQSGFDAEEYTNFLSLAFYKHNNADSNRNTTTQSSFPLLYRSPEVGMLNRWYLYQYGNDAAVISIRGTVQQTPSWIANFYAAMIPASGQLQLNDSTTFNYQLASNPKAMVHAGWTISLAHLAPDIVEKISNLYNEKKIRRFYIFGHSQGGAIAFLLRSHLAYLQQKGEIPADIAFKTYCSAAPKPGNLFYAYDFDFITRGGWAFNIVNAADWVPETPISIQSYDDFNETNPVVFAKSVLKKQPLPLRLVGNKIVNSMGRASKKAQKKLKRYLGKLAFTQVIKTLPQMKEPAYANGNNYMRAGTPIVLLPDETYHNVYPAKTENLFLHHMYEPYLMLIKKYYPK